MNLTYKKDYIFPSNNDGVILYPDCVSITCPQQGIMGSKNRKTGANGIMSIFFLTTLSNKRDAKNV